MSVRDLIPLKRGRDVTVLYNRALSATEVKQLYNAGR
jgi:hypothetical protein